MLETGILFCQRNKFTNSVNAVLACWHCILKENVCVCACAHVYGCVCMCIHVYVHVCVSACMYACVCQMDKQKILSNVSPSLSSQSISICIFLYITLSIAISNLYLPI